MSLEYPRPPLPSQGKHFFRSKYKRRQKSGITLHEKMRRLFNTEWYDIFSSSFYFIHYIYSFRDNGTHPLSLATYAQREFTRSTEIDQILACQRCVETHPGKKIKLTEFHNPMASKII